MPTPGEPLWTDEDRAWALALLAYEADQCPDCGQPRSISHSPEAESKYRAELTRCHACAAAAAAVRQLLEDEHADPAGVTARFTKTP